MSMMYTELPSLWTFNYSIFTVSKDRLSVECSRIHDALDKAQSSKTDKILQVLSVDAEVIDCVFDTKFKVLFIMCREGRIYVYQYISASVTWKHIDTHSFTFDKPLHVLDYRCCCSNGHLYWQATPGASGVNPLCADLYSTQYHFRKGGESDNLSSIRFSPPKLIISGCLPCHLMEYQSDLVIALPLHEKMKGVLMCITPVKVVVCALLHGVIACIEHLLSPVQFASITIAIMDAQQSLQNSEVKVKVVVTDGHSLVMLSSAGEVWKMLDGVVAGHVGFNRLNMTVERELLSPDTAVLLLADRLVFVNSQLRYMTLNSNRVHTVNTDHSLNKKWISHSAATSDALILCEDNSIISLSQLLADGSVENEPMGGRIGEESLYKPPTSVTTLVLRLNCLLEPTPKDMYRSQLVDMLGGAQGAVTPFSQSMAKTLQESRTYCEQTNRQTTGAVPLVITSESIHYLLDSITEENVERVSTTLTHYIDVAPKTCLTAFTSYLNTTCSITDCEHWKLFFMLGSDQEAGCPPLILLYLHLVWLQHPADIVESVLNAGNKYKEYMSVSHAPLSIVDSLLDMIDIQPATFPSDGQVINRSYLLSYYHLSILSGCEYRILTAIGQLKKGGVQEETIRKLLDEYTKTSTVRCNLVTQYLNSI